MSTKKKITRKKKIGSVLPRPKVRNRFSKRIPVYVNTGVETPTKQSFKMQCDINHIMDKYVRTGIITHLNPVAPQFLDAEVGSFQEAIELVSGAREMFLELPATLRARFGNDPGSLLEFLHDPANRSEAIQLGLIDGDLGDERPGSPEEAPEAAQDPKPDSEADAA